MDSTYKNITICLLCLCELVGSVDRCTASQSAVINPVSLCQLYTVVQHVKHFNDVVEFGENQEFTDDFEYLETGLKSSQPLNTRCLR